MSTSPSSGVGSGNSSTRGGFPSSRSTAARIQVPHSFRFHGESLGPPASWTPDLAEVSRTPFRRRSPQSGPAPLAVTFDMSYTPVVQANHAYSWWLRIYDQKGY